MRSLREHLQSSKITMTLVPQDDCSRLVPKNLTMFGWRNSLEVKNIICFNAQVELAQKNGCYDKKKKTLQRISSLNLLIYLYLNYLGR